MVLKEIILYNSEAVLVDLHFDDQVSAATEREVPMKWF